MKKTMKIMLALGGSMYLMAIHYFVFIYVLNNMKDVREKAERKTINGYKGIGVAGKGH